MQPVRLSVEGIAGALDSALSTAPNIDLTLNLWESDHGLVRQLSTMPAQIVCSESDNRAPLGLSDARGSAKGMVADSG